MTAGAYWYLHWSLALTGSWLEWIVYPLAHGVWAVLPS